LTAKIRCSPGSRRSSANRQNGNHLPVATIHRDCHMLYPNTFLREVEVVHAGTGT
jgi:hypothetical protein